MQDSADHTGRSGDIPAEPQSHGIARRLLSPAAMAILAFAVACTLAMTHYADRGGIGLSWQTSYGPAVFLACTGTFGMPRSDASASRAEWSSALDDFLNERDEAFDCNALPRNLDVGWFAKRADSSAYFATSRRCRSSTQPLPCCLRSLSQGQGKQGGGWRPSAPFSPSASRCAPR